MYIEFGNFNKWFFSIKFILLFLNSFRFYINSSTEALRLGTSGGTVFNNGQDINKVKILLANEATTMLHGVKAAKDSEITAQKTFVDKSIGKDLPIIKVKKNTITNGINIFDLVLQTKLANSKGEIRRMIKNNGLKINNEVITEDTKIVKLDEFDKENKIKVSHGKKQHVIVKII